MSRFQCFLILAGATFVSGCNSTGLTAAETNAILTIRDADFDYGEVQTYALGTEVGDLCLTESEVEAAMGGSTGEGGASNNEGGEGGGRDDSRFNSAICVRHDTSLDDEVFEILEDRMDQLGLRKVKASEQPDVIVLASAVTRSFWFYSTGYRICDPLLGDRCWDPGAGYSFTLPYGSLLLTWIDGAALRRGKRESAWLAAVPGVFGTYAPRGNVGSLASAIEQAYRQSAYLGEEP